MVIEWLKFEVAEANREQFIQQDEAIWTALLSSYPGFLSKEVWINPKSPTEVTCVIHWQSMELWQAIPADVLKTTEQRFAQAMGDGTYKLLEAKDYQVRKANR
jgi:uncharacterized protein (TIGR03792 family)